MQIIGETKNNHFVPLSYMEEFTIHTNKGHVYKYDKYGDMMNPKVSHVLGASAFRDGYTIKTNSKWDRETIENWYNGLLELDWHRNVQFIKNNNVKELDSRNLGGMFEYLTCFCLIQVTRTPFAINEFSKLINILRIYPDEAITPIERNDFKVLGNLGPSHDSIGGLFSRLESSSSWTMTVLDNKSGLSFITSDNPVVVYGSSEDSPYCVNRNVFTLLLPLTPMKAIEITCKNEEPSLSRDIEFKDYLLADVINFNRLVFKYAYRFIYSSDRGSQEHIITLDKVSPVLDIDEAKAIREDIIGQMFINNHVFINQDLFLDGNNIKPLIPHILGFPIKFGSLDSDSISWINKTRSKKEKQMFYKNKKCSSGA